MIARVLLNYAVLLASINLLRYPFIFTQYIINKIKEVIPTRTESIDIITARKLNNLVNTVIPKETAPRMHNTFPMVNPGLSSST